MKEEKKILSYDFEQNSKLSLIQTCVNVRCTGGGKEAQTEALKSVNSYLNWVHKIQFDASKGG